MTTKLDVLLEKIKHDLQNGDFENALLTIESNKDAFFHLNPIATLDLHIKTLLELSDYKAALKELAYYADLPYVSQEVEEKIRALEALIFRTIDRNIKDVDKNIEVIKNKILSNDFNEVYTAFSILKADESLVKKFKNEIKVALQKDFGKNTTYFLLSGLQEALSDETLTISYYGEALSFAVKQFFAIDTSEEMMLFMQEFERFNKNTTVYQFAINLAYEKMIDYFPQRIDKQDIPILALYFVEQVQTLLDPAFNKGAFYAAYQISNQMIKNINKKYHLGMYQG